MTTADLAWPTWHTTGRTKWYGGLESPVDRCIYGVPNSAENVLRCHASRPLGVCGVMIVSRQQLCKHARRCASSQGLASRVRNRLGDCVEQYGSTPSCGSVHTGGAQRNTQQAFV
eukprot:39301-Pyramimonas_sp.AAC.3